MSDALFRKIWQGSLSNLINIALVPHRDDDLDKVLKVVETMQSPSCVSALNSSDPRNFSALNPLRFLGESERRIEGQVSELKDAKKVWNVRYLN